jgi:hypothetical protein
MVGMRRGSIAVVCLAVAGFVGCEAVLGLDGFAERPSSSSGASSGDPTTSSSMGGENVGPSTTGTGGSGGRSTGGMGGGGSNVAGANQGGSGPGGQGGAPPVGKRAFLSSSTNQGALGTGGSDAIAAADAMCLADGAMLPGSYKAWISNGAQNAATAFAAGGPWYLVTGAGDPDVAALVAMNLSDLLDGPSTPIARNAAGSDVVGAMPVWTGTDVNGAATGIDCAGFTSATGSGTVGDPTQLGSTWTDNGPGDCGLARGVYCLEL